MGYVATYGVQGATGRDAPFYFGAEGATSSCLPESHRWKTGTPDANENGRKNLSPTNISCGPAKLAGYLIRSLFRTKSTSAPTCGLLLSLPGPDPIRIRAAARPLLTALAILDGQTRAGTATLEGWLCRKVNARNGWFYPGIFESRRGQLQREWGGVILPVKVPAILIGQQPW